MAGRHRDPDHDYSGPAVAVFLWSATAFLAVAVLVGYLVGSR